MFTRTCQGAFERQVAELFVFGMLSSSSSLPFCWDRLSLLPAVDHSLGGAVKLGLSFTSQSLLGEAGGSWGRGDG